jgi:hypothetical protein
MCTPLNENTTSCSLNGETMTNTYFKACLFLDWRYDTIPSELYVAMFKAHCPMSFSLLHDYGIQSFRFGRLFLLYILDPR